MKTRFAVLLLLTFLGFIAAKTDNPSERMNSAESADRSMWNNFHLGNYDSIPSVLKQLNEAYNNNPSDIRITAHLGFVHLWAFCERGRKNADSSIFLHIYESNRFFKKAIKLNSHDPRLYGFQASVEICEGALDNNLFKIEKGYVKSLLAIRRWKAFNKSALSFIESQRDSNSFMFRQGIKYQWEVLNGCSCKKLTKKKIMASPQKVLGDLIEELKATNDPLTKRACWNSWIAPHNLEGFFLNFGDMLVKHGDLEEAKEIYKAAKLSPSYKAWVYAPVLEERLKNLEHNEKAFNQPLKLLYKKKEKQIFINSKISCTGCHQMSPDEFERMGYDPPSDEIYFLK